MQDSRTHLGQVQFSPVPVPEIDGSMNPWRQQINDRQEHIHFDHSPHFLAHVSKEMINKEQYQLISAV